MPVPEPFKLRTWLANNWDTILTIVQWVLPSVGAAMSGIGAYLTGTLHEYAPFSWIAAALLGALVVSGITAFIAWVRSEVARTRYLRSVSIHADGVNPLDDSFHRARIHIEVLADPVRKTIEGKTFVNCDLIGPRAVAFGHCVFGTNIAFFNCDYLQIPMGPRKVENFISFKNCTFNNCRFYSLIMAVNGQTADMFDKLSNGKIQWLSGRDGATLPSPLQPQHPVDRVAVGNQS